jgi:hypothetical protein
MKYKKTAKMEAVILTLLLVGAMFLIPAGSVETHEENFSASELHESIYGDLYDEEQNLGPFILDRKYIIKDPQPATLDDDSNDDAGSKRDAGNKISRSSTIYIGEPIDNTPGRGRTGKLSSSDDEDWYSFSVCEGQNILITMSPSAGYDFNLALWDKNENEKATSEKPGAVAEAISFTAEYTGYWYMLVEYVSGPDEGQYSFDVTLNGQNDADTGNDAGDSFADATSLSPGQYSGYLDMNDGQDWYKFQANAGNGIHFNLEMKKTAYLSDFDISLYNPSGELVYEEDYYYDDELLYPADVSGEWRVKIDIFPGYIDIPQPTEWKYYTYGSGAYNLEFSIESSAPAPPGPIPQPQVTPIAKTFNIANDPDSSKDEYGYLASIPACNYLESGNRYLAPIIYEGDDTSTNWFGTDADRGTVDDTTQYLIDDWNDYLAAHGKTAAEYDVPADPIEAAAEIATQNWVSSNLAVVAVDGSGYEDTVKTVIQETKTLKRVVEVEEFQSDDPIFEGPFQYTTFLGPKWGAIDIGIFDITGYHANDDSNFLTNVFPSYMNFGGDWWPVPYDGSGDGTDVYYPITQAGIWSAGSDIETDDWSYFRVRKYAGDRYKINVKDSDSVISVKVETANPSDLLVFLVDPDGWLRAPDMPQWNGPVNPIHVWNGFENPEVNPWREWNPDPHTEFSVEVLHPEKGSWTAIVVPRNAEGPDLDYTITGELKTINPNRADAAISAANAAVIASLEHIPLLYVNEDSIPSATSNAISQLGVNKVIFVERGGIGSGVKSNLPTLEADLTTMQNIVDYIKDYGSSENYITITSIKSGDGYFAPTAMLAAYHGAPVLRIGEAPGNPAGMADRIETWRLWSGDFYHGSRSTGHLPDHSEPVPGEGSWNIKLLFDAFMYAVSGGVNGELPPLGMDAKRYWNEKVHDGIYDLIDGYGLDIAGQEAYCFVAPRKDIYIPVHSVMLGNNSYSGHMVGTTPAYTSDMVVRNILYPALIFANPNRNITTSQLMNFADGGNWKTNDGKNNNAYSSRSVKKSFGSHFRTYDGHCLWDAHLERMNDGASAMYYAGHGTGGSGTSAQYYQTEHCNYPEQIWWDAWRGYAGFDNWKIVRNNGRSWYNAEPPSLYDIVHYDYADELFGNLRSNVIFYLSCTTGDAFGPMVYLDHGAVFFMGNAGSGLNPQEDLMDNEIFDRVMIYGETISQAFSKEVWRHLRDFTTKDPTAMYGSSSLTVTTVQCFYGDPELIVYSPEWTSPVPVDA